MKAGAEVSLERPVTLHECHISWIPAASPEITINTDGSVINSDKAAYGGILHDTLGRRPVAAFAANLGSCSIKRA
ncbi:hypothetical protein LINGRAHAP2_LOCUS9875 [Linum grandiflorum]